MLSINTNLSSLVAQRSLKTSTQLLNQAVERMSTGYKVNHAKDNAAAYSIITNMDTRIGAYQVAEDNCAMGLDLLTTATESLDLIYDKLTRLRDLAEQASNGTYGEQSLKAINSEANALQQELARIYKTAEYNGIKLFGDDVKTLDDILKEKYGSNDGFVNKVVERNAATMTSAQEEYDNSGFLSLGTYSISSADELEILYEIFDNDDFESGVEIVLTNDIDLSSKPNLSTSFSASGSTIIFDGNGHVIKNLSSNGLFSGDISVEIRNLGLEDVNIDATDYVGSLVGIATGDIVIENCYVTGSVKGENSVGGLIGRSNMSATIKDCYTHCSVNGSGNAGALIGSILSDSVTIDNIAVYSGNLAAVGLHENDPSYDLSVFDANIDSVSIPEPEINKVNLQVGIGSNLTSQIGLELSFKNFNLANLTALQVDSNDALTVLDGYLSKLTEKQVEIGSVQNRLESALDEISTQYENLVSSRSTLRDADFAETSSQYIQQQILQQASATLMATANQSPSIALQLI